MALWEGALTYLELHNTNINLSTVQLSEERACVSFERLIPAIDGVS